VQDAPDAEARRLRAVLRDLVALSAIPTAWIGSAPSTVAAGLADALVHLLQLDFAYVRLSDPGGAGTVEVARGNAWTSLSQWLEGHRVTSTPLSQKEIVPDTGDDSARRHGIAVPVGVNGEGGAVVAAAERGDFPTSTDELLLSLAANHAAAAFQSARLVQERQQAEEEVRNARNELEVKVIERTAELHQANEELSALGRVATLVAESVQPAEIFSAVCKEVGRLFGADMAAVVRFEPDASALVVVGLAPSIPGIPIGTRSELDDALASTAVYRTGRSARIDVGEWASAGGPLHAAGRRLGLSSTVASPIIVEGRLWGTVSVSANEPLALDLEQRLEEFTRLIATAIANADNRSELATSRRRIVSASDEARRRIERDLHDGTQQRLVSLGLALRAVEAKVPVDGNDLRSELSLIAAGLADAVEDLQEMSRGIHPAILSQGGLGPALRTLARRSAIPVELDVTTDARLPESIEVAAYFVVSEALANAAKHAQASQIRISLAAGEGRLLVSIRDDGVGGADPQRGSGLVGLTDRVDALGGSIRVSSPPGDGTKLIATLPLELESTEDVD
jgi:signal transduction histidine kinase